MHFNRESKADVMRKIWRAVLPLVLMPAVLFAQDIVVHGRIVDPQGNALPNASVALTNQQGVVQRVSTRAGGRFKFKAAFGEYTLEVQAAGFSAASRAVSVRAGGSEAGDVRLAVETHRESVTVTADVTAVDVEMHDAAMKVYAAEDLLDANPGRPGAPISIPGYPIETASSGIKAPQCFAPGVADDRGEPIDMFIQVGSSLVPNNLSANAHGDGYTDPNVLIADVIDSVQVDGGAVNVREGNHSLNLAAVYGLRSHLDPFVTSTGDSRDATLTAGSFGNGFLDRLEHRKQVKIDGGRVFHTRDHTLNLFSDFGLGLIRQSEFRTVTGGGAGYINRVTRNFTNQTIRQCNGLSSSFRR